MVLKDTIANSIISLEEAISNIQPGGLISPNGGSIVTIEDVAEPGIGGEINLTTEIDEGVTHNPYAKIRLLSQKSSSSSPRGTEFSVDLKANDTEGTPTVRFIMQNAYYGTTSVYAGISGSPLDVEEPLTPTNAATKGYVDSFVPDRIRGGTIGTSFGVTELGVGPSATGLPYGVMKGTNQGIVFLNATARNEGGGYGYLGWKTYQPPYGLGYIEWSSGMAAIHSSESSTVNFGRVQVDGNYGGNVYFGINGASTGGGYEPTGGGIRLGSRSGHTPNVRALPSHVNSILHGIKLGVDAHDELANYDWSEYPAVQDVDLNTFKITNLVDPTNPQDAATKAYVDANSGGGGTPSKIESPSGNTSVESIDFSAEEAGTIMKSTRGDSESIIAVVVSEDEIDPLETQSEVIIGVHNPNGPDGAWIEAKYLTRNNQFELAAGGAPLYIEEPVEDRHAATKGYVDSRFAVEWWEPTWTPVANVSGVSNIECQYTRAYRAAGGSLVTLEGTITVTPEAAGGCAVEADIPLPVTGSTGVTGVASAADVASVYPAYATLIGGKVRLIFLAESTDEHVVPFRLSYRAA